MEVELTAGGLGGCDVNGWLVVMLVPAERKLHIKCRALQEDTRG